MQSLLQPKSVAVIGASDNPNKVGGRPIHYMTQFGYRGEIFPVNPGRSEVQGRRCYPTLDAIGRVPEAAIIAVSADEAMRAVEQCAEAGVTNAIVMSSGFAETGEPGRLLQEEMVGIARRGGMRLIGPNAQGIANFSDGAVLNFSTMFMEVAPKDGPIAIVSQSGAASVMPYALLREMGLGVRYLFATGNDADLGVAELARIASLDPEIRLILVYVESLAQPDALAEAARLARARGASIVLLKGGSSKKGAAAAASHTGAMVGHEGALDAFLQRHGIWRAADLHEMVNAAPLYLQGAAAGAGRTVVMSHSGAVGVMCADAAEKADLPLAEFSEATREGLKLALPGFASGNNPLDLTAALMGNREMFPKVLDLLARDPQADMFLIGIPVAGPGYDIPALAASTARLAGTTGKPTVVSAPQESVRRVFAATGLPVFRTESDAVRALRQYASHTALASRVGSSLQPAASPGVRRSSPAGLLGEADSLALLREFALPVVEHAVCADAGEAEMAYRRLQVPVVVKGCAADVPHKSEHGLVHLNLQSAEAVRAAANTCLASLRAMGAASGTVIVAPMMRGVHEFMLGASVDPVFGPIVMIGEGGTLVELRRDVVSLLAPFTEDAAIQAIGKLRIAPLFAGYRERPAMDLRALASAAVRLGDFAWAHRDVLRSVDMNPVMVMGEGKGVVAVDAVVEFAEDVEP